MAKKVYAVEAVLVLVVGLSSSIFSEDSSTPILLFAGMCILMAALTVASYQGWSAPELEVTQISGSVGNVTTKPLPPMAPGQVWEMAREITEFTVAGQPAFIYGRVEIRAGDVVTAAGVAGATFHALAMRDRRGACIASVPSQSLSDAQLQIVINVVLLPLLYGFFTCMLMVRRFDAFWSWKNAVERATDLVQQATVIAYSPRVNTSMP